MPASRPAGSAVTQGCGGSSAGRPGVTPETPVMSTAPAGWDPCRRPLHALLQLVDALMLGFNDARQQMHHLPWPRTPEDHNRWADAVDVIAAEYRTLRVAFTQSDAAPQYTAATAADAALAELVGFGLGASEDIVRRAEGLLTSLGWHNPGTNFDQSSLGRHGGDARKSEEWTYQTYRDVNRNLLAVLSRTGVAVPPHVRQRVTDAQRAEGLRGTAVTHQTLLGWIADAKRAFDPPPAPPTPPGTRLVFDQDRYPFLVHDATGGRVPVSGDGWAGSGPVPDWADWVPPDWPFEWWPLAAAPELVRQFIGLVDVYAGLEHMPPAGPRSTGAACRAGRMLARRLVPLPAGETFDSVYPPSGDARAAWLTVRDALLAWCASAGGGTRAGGALSLDTSASDVANPALVVNTGRPADAAASLEVPPPLGTGVSAGRTDEATPPDGPTGDGRTVWFNGRCAILKPVPYRVVAFMWARASAGFDDLAAHVNENRAAEVPTDATFSTWANRANNALKSLSVPWRLSVNKVGRHMIRTTDGRLSRPISRVKAP